MARLRALVPPGRRLIVVGEGPGPGAFDGSDAAPGGEADVAVVAQAAALGRDLRATLAALRTRLDPSGLLVVADAALDATTLEAAGFEPPSQPLEGSTLARPRWSADDVSAATRPSQSAIDLTVVAVGAADDAALLALRLSLPRWIGLRRVESVATSQELPTALASDPDDALVLMLPAAALPEPDWVQALWDGHRRHGGPVGLRTIGVDGRLRSAGLVSGRPFGAGARKAWAPMYTADRGDTELHAPVLCRRADLRGGVPRGRLLGAAACPLRDTEGDDAPISVGLREVWPRSVLVVGGASLEGEAGAAALAAALPLLAAEGVTAVLSVPQPSRLAPSLWAAARDAGALVFRRPEMVERSERDATLLQLAQAFRPIATVSLDRQRTAGEAAAAVHPLALLIDADPSDGPELVGAQVRLPATGDDFGDRLLAALADPGALQAPRITPIPARPRRDGLTSIVIPVADAWPRTEACLAALRAHTTLPIEVIVVDDGSTDETAQRLAERDDVVVVTNPRKRGLAAAVNQGLQAATGAHLCVLDGATEVAPGWLEELHAALAQPGTGMVGPRSNAATGLQLIPGAPPGTAPAIRGWARDWATARRGRSWRTFRLDGACLLTSATLFERIGGFGEGDGLGGADELCERVRAAGLDLRVADGSVVLHHGTAASESSGAGRVADGDHPIDGPVCAVVLSDGQADDAVTTAGGAVQIADRVLVLERSGLPDTELALAAIAHQGVAVRAVDWQDDGALAPVVGSLGTDLMVVLGAGEHVRCDEWGAARVELESAAGQPRRIRVDARSEIRVHAPVPAASERIGEDDEAVPVLQRTWLGSAL